MGRQVRQAASADFINPSLVRLYKSSMSPDFFGLSSEKLISTISSESIGLENITTWIPAFAGRTKPRRAAGNLTAGIKFDGSVKFPVLPQEASSHLRRNPPKQIHLRQPPPLKLWRSRGFGGYPFRIHPRPSGRGFLRRRVKEE